MSFIRRISKCVDKLDVVSYNDNEVTKIYENLCESDYGGLMNFWDTSVWGGLNVFALLFLGLLAASLVKKSIKPLKESLMPTAVLAGFLLLGVSGIYMANSETAQCFNH